MKKLGPGIVSPQGIAPGDADKYAPHMVESAAGDIMRAEKHKEDPELMKHVSKHLKAKGMEYKKSFKSIQDIRDHAKEMKESALEEANPASEKAEGE